MLLAGAGTAQAAADSKAARFYEDALTRYERKDFTGAILQLKNALQVDKEQLSVQVLLGKALLQNGEAVAAEVAFNEALRLGVNRAEVVLPLAQALIAQGKQRQVLEQPQFNPAGLPPGTQAQLFLIRAAAASDIGDVRTAAKSLDEARIAAPNNPSVLLAEVPVRIRAGQFREAVEAADRVLAVAPDSADAWYQKGAALHVQGSLKATLEAYDKALQLQPGHLDARISRIGLYLDLAQNAQAAKDVAELQRLAPTDPRGAYLAAQIAERNNDLTASRKALRDVTTFLDPVPLDFIRYRPQLLMLNGLAHYGLNEREKAKLYLETLQRMQGFSPASKPLAQIYLAEGNVARATEILDAYLKVQPDDTQAMSLLASAMVSQGRHARAASLLQDAIKSHDDPALRTTLGLSLISGGQLGSATTELEKAYKSDPTQTRAGFALAAIQLRNGQAAKAAATAQALVTQQPSNPSYQHLLGMAQAQAGKPAEARAAFERAISLDAGLVSAKIGLARLDTLAKNYDAAEQRLAAILKSDEKNPDALFEMALLSSQRGQKAEAQRWLGKANDFASAKQFRSGLALIELQLANRQNDLALETSKRLAAKAPDDVKVLMTLGRAQLANGDQAGAKSTLATATRFAEFNAPAQVEIAQLQVAAANPTGAAYSLEKALSGRPDYLPAMALAVDVDLQLGDAAKAEKRAREILEKAPRRGIGHSLLGDIAMARNNRPAAIEAYQRAYQAEPTTDSLLRLFRVLWSKDNGQTSLQLVDQWLRTHPQDRLAQRAQADGLARQGQYARARTTYEALLKNTSADAEVLNNLANTLIQLKDPSAVKIAEQAVAAAPTSANAIDTLGWALFLQGDNDRALQMLRDARLRQPTNPDIRYHLAAVLAKTGRRTEAREELEVALQSSSAFDHAADARALRQTLQ